MKEKILNNFSIIENVAVLEENRKWTYSQMGQVVSQFVKYYRENHLKKIMIVMKQGFYSYAAIIAAYLAGITFCPVNSETPFERLKYYQNIFNPDLIVFDNNSDSINEYKNSIEVMQILESKVNVKDYAQEENDIAYVIFTSGSTGEPKGIAIKRSAFEKFLVWSISHYKVNENDRWAQYSNIGFDLSLCDIFTAISSGATLVPFATPKAKMYPALLIKKYNITFWHSVPSVLDLMDIANHFTSEYLSTVKTYTFCGETLYTTQLKKIFDLNSTCKVYNTYGPTETTIFCMGILLDSFNYQEYCEDSVSIGTPFEGWQIYVERQNDQNIGELIICGDNIGAGYLNDMNNKSFFSKEMENGKLIRCYRTGDFVKVISGKLYFAGRKDSQIKHMGFRIDLSEIEACLRNYGCYSSKVIYYKKKIVAFVVCNDFDENKIRDYLKLYLPYYYIPSKIIHKKGFPFNKNGKVDVKKLYEEIENGLFC